MNDEIQFLHKLSLLVGAVPVATYRESYLFSDGSGPHYKKWPKGAQLKRAYRRIRFRVSVAAGYLGVCRLGSTQLWMLKQRLAIYGITEEEMDGYLEWYAVSRDAYTHSPENFDPLVEDFFESSQFSPKVKKLWASINLDKTAVVRWSGAVLNEVSLIDVINENENINSREFVEALTANESFTPKVLRAYFAKHTVTLDGQAWALEFTPDSFITPAWVRTVLTLRGGDDIFDSAARVAVSEYHRKTIAARVRKLRPEFEGIPDDWTLKLFSS